MLREKNIIIKRNRKKRHSICLKVGQFAIIWLIISGTVLTGCGDAGKEKELQLSSEQTQMGSETAASDTKVTDAEQESKVSASEQEPDNSGQQEASHAGNEQDTAKACKEILDSWDFSYGPIMLEQVQKQLEEENIHYTGYFNVSGERLDLTLENGVTLVFLETRDSQLQTIGYELIMKGTEFNKNGFQENYLNAYDVITDEYYYPDLSQEPLREEDLYQCNQTDLSIIRNQIFAKYGREFQDPFLNAVFLQKSWYTPQYSAEEFTSSQRKQISAMDQENLNLVMKWEESKGYRKTAPADYETLRSLLSGSWIDLDGDGREEQVRYHRVMEDNDLSNITLQIKTADKLADKDASDVTLNLEEPRLHSNCYIASGDGKTWQIIVASDGMSADYNMSFYQYEKGTLKKLGEIPSYVESLKIYSDKMLAMVETVHFQCQPLELEYAVQNGKITWIKKEYYEYPQNQAKALKEIPLYGEKEGKEITVTLQSGDEFLVIGGDLTDWVQLKKVSTGEQGWLKVNELECYFPDGTSETSSLLFDGLWFYG